MHNIKKNLSVLYYTAPEDLKTEWSQQRWGKSSAVCKLRFATPNPTLSFTYMLSEPYNLCHHLILHEEQTRVL